MKDSIAYLPKDKQDDLGFLVKEILKRLPQAEYIILYGSYARGNYVRRSVRIEDGGIPTVKISDYDIYVVTSGFNNKKAETVLDNVEDIFFSGKDFDRDTPVQFITDDIKALNKYLEEGRYFYTQIKQEGIVLYNSGKYKLSRRRKLNFAEIKEQAQEYFDEKFEKGNFFFDDAVTNKGRERFQMSSFYLHQACENYYYAIRLTFTLRNNKQHNLSKLSSSVRRYADDLGTVFPQNTPEEKQLFVLLKAAYVEARYTPYFVVTKEDIDTLIPKVELLRDIAKRICEAKIKEYGEQSTI
ncbi:HEPN domain-containing protein [Parabacteroides faecis]|uniref:HEPN domain-containing protein n=1 Tax=Parabacteroides TaxID=375288 RepID=UPI000EFDDA0E|nr:MULTISPECIES: HEPN domain-containing protein [Parabacteroides]MBC8620426.1 HEPN domain-containing protein [Parabacteroides faecis]RHR98617.1 HEPN domain-containing protein [Parabacteroides sp. AF14-59]